MRIVGGEFRGRRLAEPANQAIRPTADRTRESLFNILAHAWREHLQDKWVIDGFAGTGALGLEALSRGAKFVTFIEKDAQALRLIEQNITALHATDRSDVIRRDATQPGVATDAPQASLVFLDPPYGKGLGEKAASALSQNGWLEPDALLVLEEQMGRLPAKITGFETLDQRQFGDTAIGLFQATNRS